LWISAVCFPSHRKAAHLAIFLSLMISDVHGYCSYTFVDHMLKISCFTCVCHVSLLHTLFFLYLHTHIYIYIYIMSISYFYRSTFQCKDIYICSTSPHIIYNVPHISRSFSTVLLVGRPVQAQGRWDLVGLRLGKIWEDQHPFKTYVRS
jgi:hypothetical protein